jgi:hypothetical protein
MVSTRLIPEKRLALTFGEDASVAQWQSSCFVNRWSVSEIEIGPKEPYDQLFKNN